MLLNDVRYGNPVTVGNIYTAYEEAVLEYSYLVNLHQSKNSLSSLLGAATASFDQNGQIVAGHSLSGSDIALKYPRFDYGFAKRVSQRIATDAEVGGLIPIYSASFDVVSGQQDYDLQTIL